MSAHLPPRPPSRRAPRPLALIALLALAACGARPTAAAPPAAPPGEAAGGPAGGPAGEAAGGVPARSELLEESGLVRRGGPMQFFAGWALAGGGQARPLNLTTLLKSGKRRYALTICASWCAPCREGLKRLSDSRARIEEAGVGLVVLVADTNQHARALISEFGLTWASVIVDEFNTNAVKLSPNPSNAKSLNLPRTFVFDANGQVEAIIAQEGADFVDLIVGKTP